MQRRPPEDQGGSLLWLSAIFSFPHCPSPPQSAFQLNKHPNHLQNEEISPVFKNTYAKSLLGINTSWDNDETFLQLSSITSWQRWGALRTLLLPVIRQHYWRLSNASTALWKHDWESIVEISKICCERLEMGGCAPPSCLVFAAVCKLSQDAFSDLEFFFKVSAIFLSLPRCSAIWSPLPQSSVICITHKLCEMHWLCFPFGQSWETSTFMKFSKIATLKYDQSALLSWTAFEPCLQGAFCVSWCSLTKHFSYLLCHS